MKIYICVNSYGELDLESLESKYTVMDDAFKRCFFLNYGIYESREKYFVTTRWINDIRKVMKWQLEVKKWLES